MSFVILKVPRDGSRAVTIPYERAVVMKAVMEGRQQPQNEAQAAFVAQVQSIHLGIQHDNPAKHTQAAEQASIWKDRLSNE